MAIPKYGLIITAFLLALAILETGNFSRQVLPEPIEEEEYFLPHTREKRSAQTGQWNYIVEIVLNVSNVQTFELIRSALNASRLPIRLDNSTEISNVSITTVCSPTEVGVQCRCEEQFAWPYSSCVTNGCDDIIGGICSCTNVIPADGQFCQLISELLTPVEYVVDVELNVTDIATVDFLRNVLGNGDFTLTLGPTVNLTHINITTVCNSNGTHFQCRCEDQYVWSASNCLTYGACDRIFGGPCGCINSIPTNGQYCEPRTAPPALSEYIISVEVNITHSELLGLLRTTLRNINYPITINNNIKITNVNISTVCHPNNGSYQCRCEDQYRWPCNQCLTHGSCDNITDNTCGCIDAISPNGQYCQPANQHNFTACPLKTTSPPPSTTPPVLYEYIISVELNTTDVTLIDILRTTLRNINYPITINNNIQINDVNISTVCIPNNGGHQCRCEDQYRWPCNQCLTHGSCDNITDNTCGCINAVPPDGQYCQPANQHNFTACPLTTTTPPPSTTPPVLYEYIISVELNTTDVTLIDILRTTLRNINYPITINNNIQINDVNISTVCIPNNGGHQCRCEDQYRWPCNQCLTHGSCDNITDNTCGCINAVPPDGQYCQPANQHNFTACPLTTTTPPPSTTPPVLYEYIISVELNTTDVTLIDILRTTLRNINYPITINNNIQINDVNISTVCIPNNGGHQCRCEDQYRWPCNQCLTHGSCDNITDNTCGCINAVPPDGQYCQPANQHNFTACPLTTTTPPPSTTPPVLYEYIISVELNTTDVTLIDILRTTLRNINYPITINNNIQINDVNISTVCIPNNGGHQCRCEDQYRWPCNQCLTHGSCDNITDNTCGCINAVPPDGQYCQPANQHNFTACPLTTTTPPPSTTPPVLYEYIISVELNTTDVTLIDILRTTLRNINYPITINNNIQINDVNISTVCIPNNGGHQCRCEDQYRWPCNQCLTHGSCDNITDNTCGCINALPPDGQYCQPANQHNFTACPLTTTSPPTTNSTTVTTTGGNTTLTPTTVTNSTTDPNTTTVTTPPTTIVTNSTPNVTTPTATPTPNVTTTSVTSPNNTGNSTSGVTSAPTPITTLTAVTSTTTTTISTTTDSTTATSTLSTTTTPTTTSATTTTLPSTTASGFNVEMFVELDQTFTEDLNNASSDKYNDLESRMTPVLKKEYETITGFMSVSVTGFRKGSIIADFVVQTTKVNPVEVAQANQRIPELIVDIAPVIGAVTAFYNSPDQMIISSNIIYTGNTMTLICEPPDNLDVGNFSASEWKFKGRNITSKRIEVINSAVNSMLKVNNVILLDIGRYECGLTGGVITFTQKRDVTDRIRAAPIIRLQEQVNIKCSETEGQSKSLKCCVQSPYTVKWFNGSKELPITDPTNDGCITYVYQLRSCSESQPIIFICKVDNLDFRKETAITLFNDDIICDDDTYGAGRKGDISRIGCDIGLEGSKTAECQIRSGSGEWTFLRDTCIITEIKELLISSKDLVAEDVSDFVGNLSVTVKANATSITKSSETISAIVDILNNIAAVSTANVTESVMMDILETVDVIIGDDARESWALLNANETRNTSSELLGALESLANRLVGEFSFTTQRILLNRTTFNDSFKADLNNSIVIYIPDTDLVNVFITTITFSTLHNVMPVRNSNSDAGLFNGTSNNTAIDNAINAAVVLVQISETIDNVTLSYDKLNESLTLNPQCVFWNFALFDNLGAWDDEGCTFVSDINNTVTCSCNHLTSFSILMATDIPQDLREALDIITYVGVGISLASLVICLIIEGYVWKAITRNSTAFMRHVSIINTALSLLIADICFIIAASIAKNPLENPGEDHQVEVGPCSTATFFMHFFYLALFFWMLVLGLLLFYRTVMVFSHMSKSIMLAIGFLLGYGCPLIIAVITVAVTAPDKGYIRKDDACWLNWFETKALLALVIPALTIVFINLLIVVVVLFKMLRRGVGDAAQTDERHTVMVLIRCVVILTPLFGLTWSLGVGTMISSTNKGLHIAFAFFNSLQGFFILVFGTLFDSKIRSLLSRNLPTSSTGSNNQTRSTSGGISSLSGLNWINRLRGRRYVYRVSEAANSSSNGASESFMNI
ncbi:uncharacterized protein LOC141756056 isoform X3 [Sebastes fasciatus]|uniref:uncharacterized protein LOC141756056 isoform X2 n=1 Tax=Sebastes fasciatus TaxID=394691 RepID=UPI003D9E0D9F